MLQIRHVTERGTELETVVELFKAYAAEFNYKVIVNRNDNILNVD